MFDNHTNQINGMGQRNQVEGINPDTLDEEGKRELLQMARNVQEETKQYLTKGYEVGVSNRLVNDNIVLHVKIMCPTGDVVGMDIVPTKKDTDESVNTNAEEKEEHVSVSKNFVAETVNALLEQEKQSPDVPVPAS